MATKNQVNGIAWATTQNGGVTFILNPDSIAFIRTGMTQNNVFWCEIHFRTKDTSIHFEGDAAKTALKELGVT